ncbi:MAG: succinylglutamate desuccinylase/aspartoacylase family protein [Pseudomonadota bacterium]
MIDYHLDALSRQYTKVDYVPPDISDYASGNRGVPYVWSYGSPVTGPQVVILGSMHGNEIAGACILENFVRSGINIDSGGVSFAFGNPDAYQKFDPQHPYLGRFLDVDINRVWGPELEDATDTRAEVLRARELRPVIESADFVLDLHTMQGEGSPIAIVTNKSATMDLVAAMPSLEFVLSGKMHQAERIRLRDFGRFGDLQSDAVAIQVQVGQHWRASALDNGQQVVWDFLNATGITPSERRSRGPGPRRLKIIETVAAASEFEFADDYENGAFFPTRGTIVGYVGVEREPVKTPVDRCHLIMPVHFRQPGGNCFRFAVEE